MKQIILPLTVLEFTGLAIDGFMEENGLAHSPKKDITISSPQYKKNICGWGGYIPWKIRIQRQTTWNLLG